MKSAKKIFILVTLVTAIIAAAPPASATSLWSSGSSLFSDQKASAIGDIVLVRVVENFSATDQGRTDSSKDTDDNIGGGFGILSFLRAFGINTSTNFDGDTTVTRTHRTNLLVSCIVTEVLPNGNLVIHGERSAVNGAERTNVRYSGVVRPWDIRADNTVDSTRVASAELLFNGRGVITRTQRPGLINQILQAIF